MRVVSGNVAWSSMTLTRASQADQKDNDAWRSEVEFKGNKKLTIKDQESKGSR